MTDEECKEHLERGKAWVLDDEEGSWLWRVGEQDIDKVIQHALGWYAELKEKRTFQDDVQGYFQTRKEEEKQSRTLEERRFELLAKLSGQQQQLIMELVQENRRLRGLP